MNKNNCSLVITTINKANKNIKKCSFFSKRKKWNFFVVGDKKTPKNFKLQYGNYLNLEDQKKLNFKFSKICPINSYTRKNIGYLCAIKHKSDLIVETDDDNYPKNNFFSDKYLKHSVNEIGNKNWINIYDFFINKKQIIWPRGLPLDEVINNKLIINKKKRINSFYLQQGVCEGNPDVDAIYRLLNQQINIKFKNKKKISLGKSFSTFNSQNTIWFKKIFALMYLPVTCTMRCTDIWRSLIALKILYNDNKKILFFGTTMKQNRNIHNLINDYKEEIPMYIENKSILNLLNNLKLKKGEKNYLSNLLKCYKCLIKEKIFQKRELIYLKAWIKDLENLNIFSK